MVSEFHKFQHEGGLSRIRADSLTLLSAWLGRVVTVLKGLGAGVAPPRRVRHELACTGPAVMFRVPQVPT